VVEHKVGVALKKLDQDLGMNRPITRRDFVHGAGLAALGMLLPGCGNTGPTSSKSGYPPTRTGMRGSHPGSFEVAHAFARDGAKFEQVKDLNEEYDLIVVGGGISGLTAAYEYRKKFGAQSRILILDNHDDFGGHAKRNEFHQGGEMRLSWGGTMNMEFTSFQKPVLNFLKELGVNVRKLSRELEFDYGSSKPSVWFDAETYGKDVLIPGFSIYGRNLAALEKIDQFPISEYARVELKRFYASSKNVLAGMDEEEVDRVLHQTSYADFLSQHAGLPTEAVEFFMKSTDGYWGVQPHSLSTAEALSAWLPGTHLLGKQASRAAGSMESELVAMFPDGNASIARLLVQALIPSVSSQADADAIALADFDYAKLDQPKSAVRLRLSSTAVNVRNGKDGVQVVYVSGGQAARVKSKHCVLACYHTVIPHLCPEIPEEQKSAQKNQVKHPMLVTNVLLQNGKSLKQLGINGAYCPGRMHAKMYQIQGVDTGGYQQGSDPSSPVPVMFWGMMEPPKRGIHIHEQLRQARQSLLDTPFEAFEKEVRTVLHGMLSPAGFDAASDILAITVNRWPHGYSYGYLDLWDPEWPAGEAPHEIARRKIGNITIANSDAAASAYTQAAIEEAMRAVAELS
jgi:spermidine dehydrogenase